mmetsp:Transcript_8523/g.15649  ORF Transcript_8523/g.15649 Transcript_8523/m.15649 type:complete len:100 (-) Transcript_8523:689-988(-)
MTSALALVAGSAAAEMNFNRIASFATLSKPKKKRTVRKGLQRLQKIFVLQCRKHRNAFTTYYGHHQQVNTYKQLHNFALPKSQFQIHVFVRFEFSVSSN